MAEEARHDGDAPHGAAAFGTDGEVAGIDLMIAAVVIGCRCGIGWPNGQQTPAESDVVAAVAVGEEPVVADAMESGQVRFISRPDQFVINFDYLVRRLKRREG